MNQREPGHPMYHGPRPRPRWFAGWKYLGISALLATPATVAYGLMA